MSAGLRGPRAAGRGRLLALAAAAVVVLLIVVVAVNAGGGGGDDAASSRGPAGAALGLVPADALVALDLSTDSSRPAVRRAGVLAGRLPSWPGLRARLLGRLDERGCGINLRKDDGDEIAFALLPGAGGSASPLLVTDAPASGLGSGGPQQCGVLAAQRIGGLVAIGDRAALRAAAAVDSGTRGALVDRPVFRRAAAGLPRERVITAWASAAGTRRLLEPLGGLLGTLGSIVDTPGLRGAAAALVAEDARARITINRVAEGEGEPAFAPRLQSSAPADAISYVASGDLAGALQRLLFLRGSAASATLDALLRGDRALQRLSALVRESAFVVSPGSRLPRVTLLARVSDGRRAAREMRRLEGRLGALAGAPTGTPFADADLGGPARLLSNAGAALAYGFDGDVMVLSTEAAGVRAVRTQKTSLASTRSFRGVLSGLPPRVSALVFVDPNQLLRLGADTGTGLEDALQDVRDDLARVRAIGLHTYGAGSSSTVELSLTIP